MIDFVEQLTGYKNFNLGHTLNYQEYSIFYSPLISVIYLCTVFGLQYIMKNRQAFELRIPLIIFNAGLAIFSIIGSVVTIPYLISHLYDYGIIKTICHNNFSFVPSIALVSYLFSISKYVEFIDTIFIVLRKKELIFLHYYHHIATMIFCQFAGYYMSLALASKDLTNEIHNTYAVLFGFINYLIHAFMYSYYTIMATKLVRIPRWISISITASQIIQMIIGCYIHYVFYTSCWDSTYNLFYIGIIMYFSYFCLFVHYFIKRYFLK
jgi:elongation of very long chain fatty acids protein 6